MKKIRKALSLILCAVMLLSCYAFTGFAAEETYFLVMGDSIAYGYGIKNSKTACYGKIIADTCGFEYENIAVSGTTTDNWLGRLERDSVIESVAKADIISISIGGNDFLTNNVVGLMFDAMVKEDFSGFDEIAAQNRENLRSILSIIRGINPDSEIVLQTLYNPQSGSLRDPYQLAADRINESIYLMEEEMDSITVVDVAAALGDDSANFAGDLVHPSAQGNELIAEAMLKALNEESFTDSTELVIAEKGEDKNLYIYGKLFELLGNFFALLAKIF